jgi:hypothetical protein
MSLLAKNGIRHVIQEARVIVDDFASKLAPTEGLRGQV